MNSMVSSILFPDSAFDKLLTFFWHTDLTWHCKHTLCFQTCGLSPIRLAYNGSYGLQEIDAWTHSHIDLECIFFVGRGELLWEATLGSRSNRSASTSTDTKYGISYIKGEKTCSEWLQQVLRY